jgi:hypothetical protein
MLLQQEVVMSDPSKPLLRNGRTDFFVRGGRLTGNILHSGAEVLVSSASTNAAMRGGPDHFGRSARPQAVGARRCGHY